MVNFICQVTTYSCKCDNRLVVVVGKYPKVVGFTFETRDLYCWGVRQGVGLGAGGRVGGPGVGLGAVRGNVKD